MSRRVVLVTGGTRGIGAGIAAAFAARGDEVVVCGRSAPQQPDDGVRFWPCDVRDPDAVNALIDRIVEHYGRLDVVVNNAGGAPNADSATVSPRFISRVVELNLLAPFFVAQAAHRAMTERAVRGHVINIGSVAARDPAPGSAAYVAAKAGLTALTRALALDFAPEVRVNQVTVGLVATELAEDFYGDEAARERIAAAIPMGRMARPADVAAACLALDSPAMDYLNGSELTVHGGGEIPYRHVALSDLADS